MGTTYVTFDQCLFTLSTVLDTSINLTYDFILLLFHSVCFLFSSPHHLVILRQFINLNQIPSLTESKPSIRAANHSQYEDGYPIYRIRFVS
jgi:hypothetical protein